MSGTPVCQGEGAFKAGLPATRFDLAHQILLARNKILSYAMII